MRDSSVMNSDVLKKIKERAQAQSAYKKGGRVPATHMPEDMSKSFIS